MQKPNYTEINWPKTRSNTRLESFAFEIQMRRQAPPYAPPRRHLGSGWEHEGGLLNYFIPHRATLGIGLKQLPAKP